MTGFGTASTEPMNFFAAQVRLSRLSRAFGPPYLAKLCSQTSTDADITINVPVVYIGIEFS